MMNNHIYLLFYLQQSMSIINSDIFLIKKSHKVLSRCELGRRDKTHDMITCFSCECVKPESSFM